MDVPVVAECALEKDVPDIVQVVRPAVKRVHAPVALVVAVIVAPVPVSFGAIVVANVIIVVMVVEENVKPDAALVVIHVMVVALVHVAPVVLENVEIALDRALMIVRLVVLVPLDTRLDENTV